MKHWLILSCVIIVLVQVISCKETYREYLDINHLPDNKVHTVFTFTTSSDHVDEKHFDIFPRTLATILLSYDIDELQLSLTQGLWRNQLWGYSEYSAPPGGQFLVWFGGNGSDIEERWINVRNSVSGITGASLSALSTQDTISPVFSLKPTGVTSKRGDNKYVRYAVSPAEVVCTENLTPWIRLLPCGSRSGLGSLLDASKLYDTAYHALSIHFRKVCPDSTDNKCTTPIWELKQSLSLVFAPLQLFDRRNWSFKTLYGKTMINSCPLSSSSLVKIKVAEPLDQVEITPNIYQVSESDENTVVFDAHNITQSKILNIYLRFKNRKLPRGMNTETSLQAHTYISRISSSSSGDIVTLFTNSHNEPVKILYLQMIPWYLRTYLYTLKLDHITTTDIVDHITPHDLKLTQAKDRQRPYTLELILTIPAHSTVRFSIQFDALLLRWNEYPPDAHHGRSLPSGIITFRDTHNQVRRLYTESPLVYLPTPDFSMPFNVLCLVSTVIAIVYGSIFNLTTKSLTYVKESEVKRGLLAQLISAIKGALVRGKKTEKDIKTEKETNNKDTSDSDEKTEKIESSEDCKSNVNKDTDS